MVRVGLSGFSKACIECIALFFFGGGGCIPYCDYIHVDYTRIYYLFLCFIFYLFIYINNFT